MATTFDTSGTDRPRTDRKVIAGRSPSSAPAPPPNGDSP